MKRAAVALLLALALLATLFSALQADGDLSDLTPPVLVSLVVEPTYIDTSQRSQTITVTAHITDDLSGCPEEKRWCLDVSFSPLDGPQSQVHMADLGYSRRISGTAQDGVYQDTVELPQYSYEGRWGLRTATLRDNVDNNCFWGRSSATCTYPVPQPYFVNVSDDIAREEAIYLPLIRYASTTGGTGEIVFNKAVLQSCLPNAGVTYAEGTVRMNGQPVNGYHVAFGDVPDGPIIAQMEAGPHNGYPGWPTGYYSHIIGISGPREGDWYFWIVNKTRQRISAIAHLHTDGVAGPEKCQEAVVDFDTQ